ncbi:TPA: UbiD family decarboxylase [Klebsiella pneumoniae]|nr:UbiD family decarboxylase [Klebsiella pneumoniae]
MNFRAFIRLLEKQGDLVRVNVPVDPAFETGTITRRVYKPRQSAPLFESLLNSIPFSGRLIAAGVSRPCGYIA